jgi:hypothetical protein
LIGIFTDQHTDSKKIFTSGFFGKQTSGNPDPLAKFELALCRKAWSRIWS